MPLLHSIILGEGQPLLILHGFLGMSDNWKTLGKQYAANGFEVHLIDQRNHGKSFQSENFDYSFLVGDVKDYINHYNLTDCILLGHSMGGKTAMNLACESPELIKKLIIADIGPKQYPPHHQSILDALNNLPLESINSRSEAENQLSKSITDFGTRQFLLKNLYWIEKGKLGFRFNIAVLSHKMEEIGISLPPLSTYKKPTLFLKGGNSNYINQKDTEQIKQHFPLATIQTIEKAGHWLHAENPKQFLDKSLSFLNL
ncbi:MAG: alpha/beta fold hydrolase [Cellulophaga sp.]